MKTKRENAVTARRLGRLAKAEEWLKTHGATYEKTLGKWGWHMDRVYLSADPVEAKRLALGGG